MGKVKIHKIVTKHHYIFITTILCTCSPHSSGLNETNEAKNLLYCNFHQIAFFLFKILMKIQIIYAQILHSMQSFESIFNPAAFIRIAFFGHTPTHPPQRRHLFLSMFGIILPFVICF